jgi:hypothetical protein
MRRMSENGSSTGFAILRTVQVNRFYFCSSVVNYVPSLDCAVIVRRTKSNAYSVRHSITIIESGFIKFDICIVH